MRGVKAFYEVYNENNKNKPINIITIGTNRNTIINSLNENKHPDEKILTSLEYGKYSINQWSHYNGDWSSGQKLVLKK